MASKFVDGMAEKPDRCPSCGHKPVVEILYGLVALDNNLMRKIDAGELRLGGCCYAVGQSPDWECAQCGWTGRRNSQSI